MKILSIVERANRYDKALEKARQLCAYPTSKPFVSDLQDLFPELKESEGEEPQAYKTKSEIIEDTWYTCTCTTYSEDKRTYGRIWFHKGVAYLGKDIIKYALGFEPNNYQDYFRIWTIKDARDGDVLVCESGWTCIFKALVNEETFSSYCFMDSTEWFCGQGSECHTLKEEFVKTYNGKIQPATKKQRDLFFKKMQESGYEWNAEKKVLKNLKPKFNVGDWIVSANGKVNQVISVDADNVDFDGYTLDDNVYFSGTWCDCYHLWTIEDVKNGDVLVTESGRPFIFKGYLDIIHPNSPVAYCGIDSNDNFYVGVSTNRWTDGKVHPATIEQHELLFRKMKEKGYHWDKNRKELIKL